MIRVLNSDRSYAGLVGREGLGPRSRIRIGKIPWHTGHDYELTKMPVDFLVAGDTHRRWASSQRPVPANVAFVTTDALEEADLIITHVDQWILQEIDKLSIFKRCLEFDVPKVIINHGCNMVDGCTSEEMRALVGDNFVICNSSTAHKAWGIPNSTYIHHGMSPEEWPQSNYGRQNIIVTQPFSKIHSVYRNNDAIVAFEALTGIKVDWVGRDYKFDTFEKYRAFLSKSSVYFNPSFASPNPRARTEAMLCGLVPVTTNAHGESEYIENGVNGYVSNDLDELFQHLVRLKNNHDECIRLGMAARRTAQQRFNTQRFVGQWRDVLEKIIGRTFDV
jgi:hypothetical protein